MTVMDDLWAQSQTVDPEVRAYVYSLVNAVGGSSTLDGRYEIGDDAVHALKDLQRWLRLYDEKTGRYDVKRCLAEANLVKGDLLEILALWDESKQDSKVLGRLVLGCLELLVPLTWPLELDEEKTTVNNHRHAPYIQLAQVGYKRAILGHEGAQILRTVVRTSLPSIAITRRDRSRRDEGILKLVLYFFLNIVTITQPQHLPSQGDENDISRSSTIDAFHRQDVFSLLLTVGSNTGDEFVEQDVILLEILFQLLKGIDAKKLFSTQDEVQKQENDELRSLLQKEKAMLGGYAKHAPTRHNRFGTMIWVRRDDAKLSTVSGQNTISNESNTLLQMDASKKWNRPQYRGRLAKEFSDTSDLGMRVDLSESARKYLRQFVEDFLDSSFNPVFSSLRKAIAGEAARVQQSEHRNHVVMYFYLISWFLAAERARQDVNIANNTWHADRATQVQEKDNTFAYIAAVLDQETFILLNRTMQRAFDDKEYPTLQASQLAFTQILLTVQSMAESKDEEDQEIAENIQNRIFYEESTQDRVVQVLRGAEKLGLPYLDSTTECVHVFIRMLERYSKQNVDLQIRSKRRTRRKQAKQSGDIHQTNAEEDAEDAREAELVVRERKFDFVRFTNKFMTQPCVNTWVAFLHFYKDLSPSQLKRVHRFLYRLAFKNELYVYLFRVDVLLLLHRMIKGPGGLDSEMEGFKDWQQLVQQIFRKCIKWISRAEAGESVGEGWKEVTLTEMLFSKIPNTLFYLQNGYERVIEKRAPRPPAELIIKPGVEDLEGRIGVAVSLIIENGKAHLLAWVKPEVKRAIEERESWEAEAEARQTLANTNAEAGDVTTREHGQSPAMFLSPATSEQKQALFKDKHLRLLLNTLGFQRLGLADDVDAAWVLPSDLMAADLVERAGFLEKLEFDPPTYEDGKTASDMVRTKSSAVNAAARRSNAFGSDSEAEGSGDDMPEAMFPPNEREKRKSREDDEERPNKRRRLRHAMDLTEEERAQRAEDRKRREKEKNAKIKSALRITESDDETDEEADAEFFRLEEQRRKKMAGVIRQQLVKEMDAAKASDRGVDANNVTTRQKKNDHVASDMLSDSDDVTDDEESRVHASNRAVRSSSHSESEVNTDSEQDSNEANNNSIDDDDSAAAGSPATSPTAPNSQRGNELPLKEVSGNVATLTHRADLAGASDVDDDGPLTKAPVRRKARAGFIIDDDSDEE